MHSLRPLQINPSEWTMLDFIFLAVGLSGFALMAVYASAAERL